MWWDENLGRHRRSLVHKIFHVWGWPAIRWVMYRLPEETAHHLAIRGIWLVGLIDRIWSGVVLAAALLAIGGLRLLAFLPGFSWRSDRDENGPPEGI